MRGPSSPILRQVRQFVAYAPVSILIRFGRKSWCQDRRVSVHDDPPVIPDKVEKGVANSQHVVPRLVFKLDARTHASVHKQIAVGFTVWRSFQKELAMLGRQKRCERLSNLSLRCFW